MSRLPNAVPKPPKRAKRGLKRGTLTRSTKRLKARKVPKGFRHRRDYEYQRWVRGFPCWFCAAGFLRQQFPTEVEHLKTRGSGGDDFDNILPTCGRHREQRTSLGSPDFFAKYGAEKMWAAARQLTALYRSAIPAQEETGR